MALGVPRAELLERLTARDYQAYLQLYRSKPWGPVADDWRTALVVSAFTGQTPEEALPRWETAEPDAAPKVIEISFADAAKIFSSKSFGA